MRTYRAKKPVYEELNNVNELCRLCLEKVDDGIPIFKDDQEICTALAMRIMICVGLEMKHDNFLPNMICIHCQEKLDNCYKFRRKCEVSYLKLKNHLVALQINYQCNVDKEFNVLYSQIIQPPTEIEEETQKTKHNENSNIKYLVYSRNVGDDIKLNKILTKDEEKIEDSTLPVQIVDKNKQIEQRIEKPIIIKNETQVVETVNKELHNVQKVEKEEVEDKTSNQAFSNHEPIKNNQSSSLSLFENIKQPDEHGVEKSEKDQSQLLLPLEFVGNTPKEEEIRQNNQRFANKKSSVRNLVCLNSQMIQQERSENEIQIQSQNEVVDVRQQDVQTIEQNEREDDKMLMLKFAEQSSNVRGNNMEVEELQVPMNVEINPDIGTFLSGILTQLGVLRTHGTHLELLQDISSFELETGDGQHMMLQLMEEDDDTQVNEQSSSQSLLMESKKESSTAVNVDSKLSTKKKDIKTGVAWCAVCGRTFARGSSARRHARLHSGARPHVCHCGASFPLKSDLERHKLVHLAVKPHRCSQCSKSFTQEGALRAHLRSHAARSSRSLALHPCTQCDKVFLYTSGLSRHMTSHSGRMFKCSFCGKYFSDRSSLLRHLRAFHRGTLGAATDIQHASEQHDTRPTNESDHLVGHNVCSDVANTEDGVR